MDLKTGIRFLTPEAIAAGVDPLTNSDLTNFNVYAPEFRNLKYIGMEDLPYALRTIPVIAGAHYYYGILRHDIGYRPIIDMWFKDLDGWIIPIPGVSDDTVQSCAVPVDYNPANGDPLDMNKEIGIVIGSNIKVPSPYTYPDTVYYDIYYQIKVDPDNGDI